MTTETRATAFDARRIARLLLSLLALACAASGRAMPTRPAEPGPTNNTTVAPPRWRTFAPAGGRFSVSMPGLPHTSTRLLSDGSLIHFFSGHDENNYYAVEYHEAPPQDVALLGPAKMLTIAADGFQRGFRQTGGQGAVSRKSVTTDGVQGQRLSSARPGGRRKTLCVYVVGSRFYVLYITQPAAHPPAADREAEGNADKFLESFALRPAGTPNAAQRKHL